MTFGNKLLLVIVVTHIQSCTLFASQALSKTSEDLCENFRRQLSIDTTDTATECIEIEEESLGETSEQELKNKVCEEGVLKDEAEQEASEAVSCKPKKLSLVIETTSGECIEAADEPDCLQSSLTEQELKNKVCEEAVNSASSPGTVQEAAQNSITEKLAFSDADVRHYLDERSIKYDAQHQVSVQNGKAACALACCETLELQKNEKGTSFFVPRKLSSPVLITKCGVTHVKVICASVGGRWIEVYLGYNPQSKATMSSDKIYEASILLVQSLFCLGSRKMVQSRPLSVRGSTT